MDVVIASCTFNQSQGVTILLSSSTHTSCAAGFHVAAVWAPRRLVEYVWSVYSLPTSHHVGKNLPVKLQKMSFNEYLVNAFNYASSRRRIERGC